MKKTCFFLLTALVGIMGKIEAREIILVSPDERIRAEIRLEDRIRISMLQDGNEIVREVSPVLVLEKGMQPGSGPRLIKESRAGHSDVLKPVVPLISSSVKDEYNELLLEFKGNYALRFRVYNEGIAYRFETRIRGEIVVENERMDIVFSDDFTALYPEEESLVSHYERNYL
jgi:alpha-glucosidase